uniref:Ig-like domain-containing protein n=1 Tax=Maylandia zebra TaxID=106582 RepID=A0A3P9DRD2_9CICH
LAYSLRVLYLGLKPSIITTVSKVSVKTGKSISIPCLYESKYRNHVKYFCEGAKWRSCNDVVKTNTADPSGKYSISDDKNQFFFTVTINNLTNENTDYWCVVEINNGPDYGEHFQLSVTSGTPSLYVDHQMITGYIGESTTIRCHHSNSGEMKWCRLGRNCVTGSSGSIDGTTVTTYMSEPNVFTVTMSGLQSEDSGWYWCAKEDIQIPVYLTVTEKPITSEYCKVFDDWQGAGVDSPGFCSSHSAESSRLALPSGGIWWLFHLANLNVCNVPFWKCSPLSLLPYDSGLDGDKNSIWLVGHISTY